MDDFRPWLALALVGLFFGGWVWLLFRRPTGPRIVRFARRYMAEHPGAVAGDLRDALRRQFLGGVERAGWGTASQGQQEGEALAAIAEGVRDRWFPIDRAAIAGKIEAAVAIAGPRDNERPT